MEYILQDTDIFDAIIGDEFDKVLIETIDNYIAGTTYQLILSFDKNLLKTFALPLKTTKMKNPKRELLDKMYDLLSCQLETVEKILEKNGIEIYLSTIQGEVLDNQKYVKIKVIEDASEPIFTNRNKKQR